MSAYVRLLSWIAIFLVVGVGSDMLAASVSTPWPRYQNSAVELTDAIGGHGSGVYVGPNLIASVWHVAKGTRDDHVIAVRSEDGTWVQGKVVLLDKLNDVALIQTTVPSPSWSPLDCGPVPQIGTPIVAIGVPGDLTTFVHSPGQIISKQFIYDNQTNFLISAVVAPGFSGGPIIAGGQVVGLSDAIIVVPDFPDFLTVFGETVVIPSAVVCDDYKVLTSTPNAGKGVIIAKRRPGPAWN